MTTWPAQVTHQPPPTAPPTAPHPVPPTPRRFNRRWARRLGAAGLVTAALGATVAITYTLAHTPTSTTGTAVITSAVAPTYSLPEQTAAKDRVCRIFEDSTRGLGGQGGAWVNGEPNQLVILRDLDGVVALEDTLTPSVPPALAETVHKYISAKLELTTTALDTRATVDDVIRLNDAANAATDDMLTACR